MGKGHNAKKVTKKPPPQTLEKPRFSLGFSCILQFSRKYDKYAQQQPKDLQNGTPRSPNGAQEVPKGSQNRAKDPPRITLASPIPPRCLSRGPQTLQDTKREP